MEDVWMIKTDNNGDTLWTRTYGGIEDDQGESIQQTDGGGYIIGGTTRSYGTGYADVWLIKTDANGDSLWTRTFGTIHTELGSFVRKTMDGGYIITGKWCAWIMPHWGDLFVLKTDANGDEQWNIILGEGVGSSVQQTVDGGYIVAGYIGAFWSDVWLIRLAPDQTWINEQDLPQPKTCLLFPAHPNPFNPTTTIRYQLSAPDYVNLSIYDVQGRLVTELVNGWRSAGVHEVTFDGSGLASGVYIYQIQAGDFNDMGKMLLLK
jgi:hypothetical protein